MVEIRPIRQATTQGISRTFQESGEQRRVGGGRKRLNWLFEKSAIKQITKPAPKMATLLEPSKTKHNFRLSEGLIFWDKGRGEEVKCTNVISHSMTASSHLLTKGFFHDETISFRGSRGLIFGTKERDEEASTQYDLT